jgi:ADP-ribosylglycohydrolase
MNSSDFTERFPAVLVGCAVGDALGMPVEGWPKARIQKHVGRVTEMMDPVILRDDAGNKLAEDEFGKLPNWTEIYEKGEYTDDTILTLAVAESIIERGLPDLHHICQKQLGIYQEFSQGRSKCGFGGTTKDAFANLLNGVLPTKSGVIGGPGTGPPMKMAPIGMWMACGAPFGNLRWSERLKPGRYFAKLIGQSTHQDPRSWVCGILQADAIWRCLIQPNGSKDPGFFIQELLKVCNSWSEPLTEKYRWHHKGPIRDRLQWILADLKKKTSVEEAHKHLGSSSAVYQAYPFVLWMFTKYWDDPIAGLEELVNCGGDCDTTGAMYGALVGAKHGMVFPEKWTSQLKGLDHLVAVGQQMASMADGN